MNLQEANYTIKLERNELSEICFCIKRSLLESIEDHYNSLQQNKDGEPVFDEQEKTKVFLLKDLSKLSGYDIYEDFLYMKNKMFAEKREERDK